MTFHPGAVSRAPQGLLAWEHARFDRIASDLALPEATVCALHCATRSVTVQLPLTHDDGSTAVLLGYHVQLVVRRVGPEPSAAGLDRADERRRVLDRLDHTWERVVAAPSPTWRDTALSTALRRVVRAMELSGELTPPQASEG